MGGGISGVRFFWPWLKFLLTLRDAHPIPQIWSHYCKRIVFSVWLIYLSGWILIRVEETNSLLLNGQPFSLFSSPSAGDLKAREWFFFSFTWCFQWWKEKTFILIIWFLLYSTSHPGLAFSAHYHTFYPSYLSNFVKTHFFNHWQLRR